MRTGLVLSLAAGAVALALVLPTGQSNAAPASGASNLPTATQDFGDVEQARTVCRRWWNGYRWRQNCWWVGPPRYYGPGPYYRHHHRYYHW